MRTGVWYRSRRLVLWAALVSLAGVIALAAGCGAGGEKSAGDSGGGDAVLEVVGRDGTESYTLDDLRDMPSTEGYWGMKSSTGRIYPPVLAKGVLIEDVFAEVGGLSDDMAVGIAAKDGYEMTVSVAQLRSGDFITYDMVTGEENQVEGPLRAIVAYEYDGKPFDPETEGPLRLAIVSTEKNQVTDGHWAVKWLNRVQLKTIEHEWRLILKGKLIEEIDRATFETGAAQGCHGTGWTDANGDVWTGVPLYLLVGRVDDDIVHEGPAYNRSLAEAGYEVRIITADGKTAEVSSATMYYNEALIVACKVNGEVLPDEYWPLRLVGDGIEAADMVGQIAEIEALVPTE